MVIFLLFSYWTIQLLIYILDDSVYNKPQGELAMGDISVIARRLSDKYVQYGWSGNAGYPGTVGARLWMYYNTPEMVEYLFGLGQLRQLCKPGSETSADPFRTMPTGQPHWVGTSELDIYNRIAFVDHAYLYDLDGIWYYIAPLIIHTKIPLNITLEHTNQHGILDLEFRMYMERIMFKTVQRWFNGDMQFREYAIKIGCDDRRISELGQMAAQTDEALCLYENYELMESLRKLYYYFDPWAVVKTDKCGERINGVILSPRSNPRVETINWSE